jgi:hypothetical protein
VVAAPPADALAASSTGSAAVLLPDHPWFPNDVMQEDPALLEQLLELETGPVDRALFGRIPLRILGDALVEDTPTAQLPGCLWIMHLSGYFGGVWLRRELALAQPDAPLLGVDVVPNAEAFAQLTTAQLTALNAAQGEDVEALAFAAGRFDHHLDGYGYNHGYLTEILASPPAGLTSPAELLVAPGVLDACYAIDEVAGLAELRDRFEAVAADLDLADMAVKQADAHARGRAVWSTGLSVQGFPQAEYDRLLELSAYFLQGTQSAALAMVLASTAGDVGLARRAAVVDALLEPWSASYVMGLLDGRDDRRLPSRD